jgi:threonylcarbamoyladenosine tRNA methylthiotransferase MtaB
MKYIIYTLGCKVNQYETQAIEALLVSRGHKPCAEGEIADAVIVNTCAVTAEAGRKSRQAIHRLREENPGAVAAVLGCYSQLSPDAVQKLGADIVYGTADRLKLIDAVEKAVATGEGEKALDKPFERRVFEELPAGAVSGHTRALLKIQDGCVNFCSYCIIPYTRGRVRSLPMEAAVRQAAELDKKGYRELVITGIEIASYGVDLPGRPDLADVVCAIAAAAPHMRLRLGSIEPSVITEDFCKKIADCGSVCRHFHLSLQSGCDATLKAMNRKYDTARFYEAMQLLRRYFPDCGMTCDVIVGFPGETEEHQLETLDFLKKAQFSDAHIFPYSRRPGTPADKMDGQIDRATKAKRSKQARAVVAETRSAFLESMIGKTLPVLFETQEGECWQGHSDNYLEVRAEGENLRGTVHNVRIDAVSEGILVGNVI